MSEPPPDTAALVEAWSKGDKGALDALLPLVYDELRRLARAYLRRERPGHTLQTTALVHEAYLRLLGQREVSWTTRGQLLGLAAQMMRRILVNHARDKKAGKRGGGAPVVSLTAGMEPPQEAGVDVAALDEALSALETIDPRQARVVELRYFAGLDIEETAKALDISPATVKREWQFAKLWLRRAMSAEPPR